jgi:hypothetical protein
MTLHLVYTKALVNYEYYRRMTVGECYHNLYFHYLFVTTVWLQLQLHWHTYLLDSLTFQALCDICDGKMNSNIYQYNWKQTVLEHGQVFNRLSPGYN